MVFINKLIIIFTTFNITLNLKIIKFLLVFQSYIKTFIPKTKNKYNKNNNL